MITKTDDYRQMTRSGGYRKKVRESSMRVNTKSGIDITASKSSFATHSTLVG